MIWIRQLPVLLAGGVLAVGVSQGETPALGDASVFLSARREPFVVVVDGWVPTAARAATLGGGGSICGLGNGRESRSHRSERAGDASRIPGAADHLDEWLPLLEEGADPLDAGGGSRSPVEPNLRKRSPKLNEAARRALPETWELDAGLKAGGAGQHAVLSVRWEAGALRCEGFLPGEAWRVHKVAWTKAPGLQLVINDQVRESPVATPVWLDGLPVFAKQFQSDVREGVIHLDSSGVVLRGKVADLVSKLREGKRSEGAGGQRVGSAELLEVDPSARLPDVVVAFSVPPPAPVVTELAAVPSPMPMAAPPEPKVAAKKASVKPVRPGAISIFADSKGLRLDGELPNEGVKSSIAGTCGSVPGDRKVADQTKVSQEVRVEAWHQAIPACVMAISEQLAHGELRIADGKVTLQGIAKTVAGRDRLAAVARALPNDMRIDDHTTVPEEVSEELFSRNIYFNTGSTYIKPEHREHLREIVAAIKAGGGKSLC